MTKEKLVEKIRELLNADRDLNFLLGLKKDARKKGDLKYFNNFLIT